MYIAVITLVLLLATIVLAAICMTNFNRGLKQQIDARHSDGEEDTYAELTFMNARQAPPVSKRMALE